MKRLVSMLSLVLIFMNCAAPEVGIAIRMKRVEEFKIAYEQKVYEEEFNAFALHMRNKESGDSLTIVNQIGCMGYWQFSPSTLRYLGYPNITPSAFKKDPSIFPEELQFELFKTLVKLNDIELRPMYEYIGKEVKGVTITKSGLLAAAHLGGAMGVKLFLLSDGRINRQDVNHTSILDYLKEFSGYKL